MKSLFIFICFLLVHTTGRSQNLPAQKEAGTLKGKVIDKKTQEALIGATIFVHELKTGAVTDINGNYSISRLPVGKFLIEVKYTSYAAKIEEVYIEGEKTVNFEMEQSVAELREIVVTGVSSATQSNLNPVATTIVGKAALLENASTNIIDAVSHKPGISQVSSGASVSKPNIRGLGYNRVVTLYNGVRQEGQQWGDEHGIEIDEMSIDRVEIIKGPGSLMYGSDAIAGVLNMITTHPLPEGTIAGNILANYQTNNNLTGYSVTNSGNIKGVNWNMRFSEKSAENYQNKYDGFVFNSGFKEWNVNGYVGINRKWGYSQIHFTSFNQTLGIIDGARDSSGAFTKSVNDSESVRVTSSDLKNYTSGTPFQKISHQRLFINNQFILGRSRLSFNVGYQLNQRQEFGNPQKPDEYGLYFFLPTWNYDAKFFLPEFKGWKTSFGTSGMFQQNVNKGSEYIIPDYNLFDAGGFFFAQKQSGKLFYSGGFRYDTRKIISQALLLDISGNPASFGSPRFLGFSKFYQNYSASAGMSYQANKKVTFKLNLARGYRAPNISELASNGIHEGSNRFETGNRTLNPETSFQIDLGLEYNSDHITIELNSFNNNIQNYIYASRLPSYTFMYDPNDLIPMYKFIQGTANLYGGEISVDVHPHPWDWLHFENSFSIVKGELLNQPDSSKYLPFIPAPRIQSELRANFRKKGNYLRNMFAKIEFEYYFNQDEYLKENHSETATPSYMLLHAGIGSDIISKKGRKLFSVYFTANNLLDEAYQNHLSRLKYLPANLSTGRTGVFNMGRNFSMKLLIPFDFKK